MLNASALFSLEMHGGGVCVEAVANSFFISRELNHDNRKVFVYLSKRLHDVYKQH